MNTNTQPDQAEQGRILPDPDQPDLQVAMIPSPCVQNHAANLMPLANGDLACVWFGGTQEGMADISVYFSRLPAGSDRWQTAVKLSDDPARSEQNPVLFPTPDGQLWLLWTAQVSGNQDTAFVRRRVSPDNGLSWGPVETLFDQQAGRGLFIRQPITVIPHGDWLLPVFYCQRVPGQKWVGDQDTSGLKASSDQGRTWRDIEVPHSVGCVHMCVNALPDGSLLALYRSRWADHIYESRSADGGLSWSAPVPTTLPNNNSSIQATVLRNGDIALVFNDVNATKDTARRTGLYDEIEDNTPSAVTAPVAAPAPQSGRTAFWGTPRAPLTLAISQDGGKTWSKRDIETGDGYCMTNNSRDRSNRELSYPSIKQTADGALHVAYTHFRQAIKYVRVPEGWAQQQRT
jgi:predicted neuraminidase